MKLPAGKYWVGDPCYAISDESKWDEFCDNFFEGKIHNTSLGSAFAVSTAYGDGSCFDMQGREYPVEAGMIGVVHENLMDIGSHPFGMHLVEFKDEFEVSTDGRYIFIGGIKIDTDPDIEEGDWYNRDDFDDEQGYDTDLED